MEQPSITVKKQKLHPDPEQDFVFTLTGTGGSTKTVQSGGEFKWSPLVNGGVYVLSETAKSGWKVKNINCTASAVVEYDVAARTATITLPAAFNSGKSQVTCTFINEPSIGSVVIEKVTDPDESDQDFSFTTDLGDGSFELDTKTGGSTNSSITFSNVEEGDYFVTEGSTSGWELTGLSCDDDSSSQDGSDPAKANIKVIAGKTVTCTFTNTRQSGSIQVVKDFSGTSESVTLKIGTSAGGLQVASKVVSADGATDVKTVDTGTYFVSEVLTTPASYTTTLACVDTAPTPDVNVTVGENNSVPVGAGETVVCTFTNTATAAFTVAKDFSDNNAAAVTVSLTCASGTVANTDPTASEADPANFIVNGFASFANTCTATETAVPAGYSSAGTCTATIADGTCTLVNEFIIVPAVTTATFTVGKDFSDGNAASVPVSVLCTSGSVVANDSTASEVDPADFTVSGFAGPGTSTCTATETAVPTGYTSAGVCTATIAVGACTLTNTLNTAPFVVVKDFVPDSDADVQVSLSCTSGSTVANDATASESDPADFTIRGFVGPGTSTCTATELAASVPAGYTSAGTCTATIAAGVCTITNTSEVTVAGTSVVRTDSSVVQRALVAGESVNLTGNAPDGCRPVLRVDGTVISQVAVGPGGKFDVDVATDDLSAGRHVAEIMCSSSGVLVSKTFWIVAPMTSSNVLAVGLLSVLTLSALGWVGVRTLRDSVGGGAG